MAYIIAIDEELKQILRTFSLINWKWNYLELNELLKSLGFTESNKTETGKAGSRITYEYRGKSIDLDIYIFDESSDNVSFLEIPVYAYFETEFLAEEEYNTKMHEVQNIYKEVLDFAVSVLGKPQFSGNFGEVGFLEEWDALTVSLWNLNNAVILETLSHQDSELPILISFYIEPSHNPTSFV